MTATKLDTVIAPVLRQFGLTVTEAAPLGGNVTRGWRLTTTEGPFVLREHPASDEALVRTRHAVLRFLEHRFPHAPRVRAGSDSVVAVDGTLYEVLTYLPGESAVTPAQFDFADDELVVSAGALLGKMHRVLREYPPPTGARWASGSKVSGLADAMTRLELPGTDVVREALPLFLRFDVPPAGDRTPRHVVHNDFAWYNCTRIGGRIGGIFDWDAASIATELRDVAYAVYAFAPIGPQRSIAQTETRIAAFLRGYAEALDEPLAASREQLLDMVAHRVALSGADLVVRAADGDERAIRIFDHAVGYAQWLKWYAAGGARTLGAASR
ncbi:MAG: phosphotransferase enzyme family protein [Candidatus Limnocylindria bacterium]